MLVPFEVDKIERIAGAWVIELVEMMGYLDFCSGL